MRPLLAKHIFGHCSDKFCPKIKIKSKLPWWWRYLGQIHANDMSVDILCTALCDFRAKVVGAVSKNVFCKKRPQGGARRGRNGGSGLAAKITMRREKVWLKVWLTDWLTDWQPVEVLIVTATWRSQLHYYTIVLLHLLEYYTITLIALLQIPVRIPNREISDCQVAAWF